MSETNLTTRKMAVAPKGPSTLDDQARTVDAVMTTETPAKVVDWERWEIVDEILILDGAQYAKQLPLLNSHDRSGVEQALIQVGRQGTAQMIVAEPRAQQRRRRRLRPDHGSRAFQRIRDLPWRAGNGGAGQCFDRRADFRCRQAKEAFAPPGFNAQQSTRRQSRQMRIGR